MKCKTRKYADGGKVMEREYGAGQPTYLKSVMAKVGVGDGYGSKKAKKAEPKRLSISSSPDAMTEVMAKRKAALDP